MTKRWASAGLVIVTVVAVAGVIFGVRIPVASAHARLVASVPTANAVLETAPVRILLDFDEDIEIQINAHHHNVMLYWTTDSTITTYRQNDMELFPNNNNHNWIKCNGRF